MNRNRPLSEMESLLRRIKPTAAVREAHKHELRQRLLTPQETRFLFPSRFVYAGLALVLFISLALFSGRHEPVIGVLTQNGEERSIRNLREYEFDEPATIQLTDSELQVEPNSRIAINTTYIYSDAPSVSDISAHTVVRLDKGSLDIHVKKRSDNQTFWVETPDARVQVTGTKFQVTVTHE